jgi:hypothetical protein
MRRIAAPEAVWSKMKEMETTAEQLQEQLARMNRSVEQTKQRLTGGFQKNEEWEATRATLRDLQQDEGILRSRLGTAQTTLQNCKQWLDELPENAELELVKVDVDGLELVKTVQQIKEHEDKIDALTNVPILKKNYKQEIAEYVIRDRHKDRVAGGPGSAAHHFVPRCARDRGNREGPPPLSAYEADTRPSSHRR